MEEEKQTHEVEVEVTEPIIIKLGKQRRKRIKQMMKGRGKLWFQVEDIIDEVQEVLGEDLEGKTLVPLILVYRQKNKRPPRWFGF
jgi:hypothetical protein